MNVAGKVVVVTGASSGIGRALALLLARRGSRLVLAARRAEALESVAADCRAAGAETEVVPTDVRRESDCVALLARATDRFGRVDILVNNAGYAIYDTVSEARPEDVESIMDTNYGGTVRCTRAALPQMLARGEGTIVNVGSITGIMGFAGMSAYCASKFAVSGFSEALRDEVKGRGIHVALVCPATTRTDFFATAEHGKMPAASRLMLAMPPERVARTIVRAIETRRDRIIVPIFALLYMRLKEVFPGTAHFFMRHVSALLEGRNRR